MSTPRSGQGAGYRTIVTESGICCLTAPLVADTVAEYVPARAALVAASLSTLLPDPGALSLAGVKVSETPPGNPVIEKVTAALKPPLTVTFKVRLLFDPPVTESEFAERAA